MQAVVAKYDPQIRKVLKMDPHRQVTIEDLKQFCSIVFSNDINLYHDRLTLVGTLDRLLAINLMDIPYNFN